MANYYDGDQGKWRPIPHNVTLNEYYRQYAHKSFYKNLKYLAWGLYGTAAVNLLPLILTPFSPLIWTDVILVALMGLKLEKKRKSSTAWSIFTYGVFNVVGGFFLPMDGWMDAVVLVIGAIAIKLVRDAKKEFQKLKASRTADDAAFF